MCCWPAAAASLLGLSDGAEGGRGYIYTGWAKVSKCSTVTVTEVGCGLLLIGCRQHLIACWQHCWEREWSCTGCAAWSPARFWLADDSRENGWSIRARGTTDKMISSHLNTHQVRMHLVLCPFRSTACWERFMQPCCTRGPFSPQSLFFVFSEESSCRSW